MWLIFIELYELSLVKNTFNANNANYTSEPSRIYLFLFKLIRTAWVAGSVINTVGPCACLCIYTLHYIYTWMCVSTHHLSTCTQTNINTHTKPQIHKANGCNKAAVWHHSWASQSNQVNTGGTVAHMSESRYCPVYLNTHCTRIWLLSRSFKETMWKFCAFRFL